MKKLLIIPLLVFTFFSQAQTEKIYAPDSVKQMHSLKAYTHVLVDSLRQLSDEEIISGRHDSLFIPHSSASPSKNATFYWLCFTIQPAGNFKKWWLLLRDTLEFSGYTSQNDSVDVFYTANGKITAHEKTGVMVRRSEKSIKNTAGFNGVLFSVSAGVPQTVYIKVRKLFRDDYAFSYPVIQHPAIPVPEKDYGIMLLQLSTIAVIFFILSFFFFFFIKEKSYLLFAVYTLLLSQHYLILHYDVPFIDRYIPEHPQLVYGFWALLTQGSLISFCFFGRLFINLPRLSKLTDKWFHIFLFVWAGLVLIEAAWLMIFQKAVLPAAAPYIIAACSLLFFIRFAFFKTILARLYVGGALWLIVFTVLGFLWGTHAIYLPFNPWPVGQVGQLLIYAAALAYKVRLNEKMRAEAVRIKDMDEIKSKFFANISHEFRTPLTLIQGPLQQIEENANSRENAVNVPVRHIKTMRRNTDRLLELVNQLLDLSKLDSGKMHLQVIKGDVLQLVKVITASFESIAERKNIHYHVHFPEGTTIAFFDKDKLEKIISNLLANAFKYTPEQGAVSVNVDTEENRLRFSVEDNGPGISKKELDKIFDRFYQAEGNEDKGSGIGLALVKELVHLYKGQISVNSEPGKGSRFKISLPIDKVSFNEKELIYGEWKNEEVFISRQAEETEAAPTDNIFKSHLPLLLIAEDNADLRNYIKETLQEHYNITEAVNGKEGLEKAIAEVPDIIVSDVMMPVMSGFDMAGKLKKDERTSHIPVILLTAKAGQQHKLEGLETGADDYLTKPFDAKELLLRIQNLITQRKLLRKKFAGEILLTPAEVAVNSTDEIFLNKVMQAIEKNMSEEEFGVEELAKEVAMSRSQLHRKLSALTGQSPSEVLRNTRLVRAKELLQKKAATPSEVAFRVGFNSHAYFSRCFKEQFGISPSEVKFV